MRNNIIKLLIYIAAILLLAGTTIMVIGITNELIFLTKLGAIIIAINIILFIILFLIIYNSKARG